MNEKEINIFLLDQQAMLKRLKKQAEKENAPGLLELIEDELNLTNAKLYQKPPMISE